MLSPKGTACYSDLQEAYNFMGLFPNIHLSFDMSMEGPMRLPRSFFYFRSAYIFLWK